MQVADKDGLRQIASEEEFKSLVIECGLNQPRTVSLKNVYPKISVSVLLTLYIITVFIIAFCVCVEM